MPRIGRTLASALWVVVLAGCASLDGARLYARGSEALERGEWTAAIAHLEQAVALVPEASEIHNHLGIAYAAAGRETEALREFERAVDLDCDNQAAQENLLAARRRAAAP